MPSIHRRFASRAAYPAGLNGDDGLVVSGGLACAGMGPARSGSKGTANPASSGGLACGLGGGGNLARGGWGLLDPAETRRTRPRRWQRRPRARGGMGLPDPPCHDELLPVASRIPTCLDGVPLPEMQIEEAGR